MSRKPTDPDFDQRIADWLEADPARAPRTLLATVLAAFPSIPQRHAKRVPWRLPTMNRIVPIGAAIALVAVVGFSVMLLGSPGSPGSRGSATPIPAQSSRPSVAAAQDGPNPSPSLSAVVSAPAPSGLPALDATFQSPWYGYRVAYPAGWQVKAGAGPWPLGENLLHGNAVLDQIMSPSGAAAPMRLVGASIALPAGMTMDGFRAFASPPDGRCTPLVAPLPASVPIDGVKALVSLNGCHSLSELGGNIYDLLVISGGRGYDFTLDGDLTASEAMAWLAAIRLQPAVALPDTSTWTAHTSVRNGLSFAVPAGWAVESASAPWAWSSSANGLPPVAAFDQLIAPSYGGFVVASQPLPAGVDEAGWWSASLGPQLTGRGPCLAVPLSLATPTVIDGVDGHSDVAGSCAVAVVLVQGRAYLMEAWAELEKPLGGSVDPAPFNAWLTTIRFDPARAVSAPAPSTALPTP